MLIKPANVEISQLLISNCLCPNSYFPLSGLSESVHTISICIPCFLFVESVARWYPMMAGEALGILGYQPCSFQYGIHDGEALHVIG
jgi:hypothetical protein